MKRHCTRLIFTRTSLTLILLAACAAALQGCIFAFAGAAASGGALMATDRRTLGTQTEDREIQIKALPQLHRELPDTAHVNVTVFNRRALLTGEVPDDQTKQRAQQIVRSIVNVNGITNELSIEGASSLSSRANDSYLTTRVKAAIVSEKDISANHFKIVSERSIIYLLGLVTVDEGRVGAELASRVPGVEKVVQVYQYIAPENPRTSSATSSSNAAAASADNGSTNSGVIVTPLGQAPGFNSNANDSAPKEPQSTVQ